MFISDSSHPHINFVFMKAGEKLRKCLEEAELTNVEFARLIGVPEDKNPNQKVQNWKVRGIPAKHSFEAGRILGQNPEWLCFDDDKLPSAYSPETVAKAEYATRQYDSLTDRQKELISDLIREVARR